MNGKVRESFIVCSALDAKTHHKPNRNGLIVSRVARRGYSRTNSLIFLPSIFLPFHSIMEESYDRKIDDIKMRAVVSLALAQGPLHCMVMLPQLSQYIALFGHFPVLYPLPPMTQCGGFSRFSCLIRSASSGGAPATQYSRYSFDSHHQTPPLVIT
jgi:hypothetical protein